MRKEEYIRVFQLKKKVRENQIFEFLDLTVYARETAGLVGDENSGVDHLCRIFAGESGYQSGRLYIKGKIQSVWQQKDAYREGIYRIHRKSQLLETMNIAENLCLIRRWKEVPLSERWKVKDFRLHLLASEYLEEWGMKIDTRKYPGELTAAERLIIMIIRAEMCGCRYLILDHVCAAAIEENAELLSWILLCLRERGIGVLTAESRPELIEKCVDRMIIMKEGQLVGDYYGDEYRPQTVRKLLTGTIVQTGDRKKNADRKRWSRKLRQWMGKEPLTLSAGEILGIQTENGWKAFLSNYDGIREEGEKTMNPIALMLGESRQYGLHEDWSRCENLAQYSFPQVRSRVGILPMRVMEYLYRKSWKGTKEEDKAWETLEGMSSEDKFCLALESLRITQPKAIVMVEISPDMDVVHLETFCRKIKELSSEGISVVFLDPPQALVRKICQRLLKMKGTEVEREYSREETQRFS
ncbi:MAG: ATP-binding cassette domain-containing protein [Clostridiales bacterium]|nr:ATP-binding cassette domain-containing protein [Clostridiales bacterium]